MTSEVKIKPGKRPDSVKRRESYWAPVHAEFTVRGPETRPGRWREAGPVYPVVIKRLPRA